MTVEHKAWDWNKNVGDIWRTPAEESYFLVNRWKEKGFERFLDLGCGVGRHSFLFAENGFSVSAFDLSAEAVRQVGAAAASRGLPIEAAHGDMIALPYADGRFDCVLAYHVISHTDTAGIKKVVAELHRVLKPGGEFFVTLCSKKAWSYAEAGFPVHDENTVIKVDDGPENGIPHFFADDSTIGGLFDKKQLIFVKHTQDLIVDGQDYGSWHYFILGKKD